MEGYSEIIDDSMIKFIRVNISKILTNYFDPLFSFLISAKDANSFPQESTLEIIKTALDAFFPEKPWTYINKFKNILSLTAMHLESISKSAGAIDSISLFFKWFLVKSVEDSLRKNLNLIHDFFSSIILLLVVNKELFKILFNYSYLFQDLKILRELSIDLQFLHEYTESKVINIKTDIVASIVEDNFQYLVQNSLLEAYLEILNDFKSKSSRNNYLPFYLIKLRDLGSKEEIIETLKIIVKRTEVLTSIVFPPICKINNIALNAVDTESELRTVMDVLVNPKFDKHIERNSFPKSTLEKIQISIDELTECRSIINANKLADPEIKYMDRSVNLKSIVLSAQSISDYLLFCPKKDISMQQKFEHVGGTIFYLINEIKDKFVFDKIIVRQNSSILRSVYNKLQCCLFNNRAFFKYGLRMAIDPFTRMLFIKAYNQHNFFSDIGCAVVFECEDEEKDSYWVLDGLIGNYSLFKRINYPWQKVCIDSLIKFARFKKSKLLLNSDFHKYREEIDRQFHKYVANNYKLEEKSIYLEKKSATQKFSVIYNYTWSGTNEALSQTKGIAQVTLLAS